MERPLPGVRITYGRTRAGWTPARELEVGERVRDVDGKEYEVTSKTGTCATLTPLAGEVRRREFPAVTKFVNGSEVVVRKARSFETTVVGRPEHVSVCAAMERIA